MKPFRYSTLQDFLKCPKLYQYKHVEGLLDTSMHNQADLSFGTCVHAAIHDLFEGGDGLDVFHTYWQLEQNKGLTYGRYKAEDLTWLGEQLIERFRDEQMKHFVPAHMEKKLQTKLGEHNYSGTADFVGTYRGVPSVVDWKTSAMPYDQYKIQVNEQMYGYAMLVERELGYKAEQIVYGVAIKDIKNPRWQFKTRALTSELLDNKLANINVMCNTIHGTSVFMKNTSQCVVGKRICPFFNKCHGGQSGDGEEEA